MGLFDWLRRGGSGNDERLLKWRRDWDAVVQSGDFAAAARLRSALDALGLSEEDIEVEREMLDGLERLAEVTSQVASEGLPSLVTGHRVVGRDTCHFSSPVSMPDEPSQPSGRLLLTGARAIFVGGANGTAVAWHAVAEVLCQNRDVVLVRRDRERVYRFRCNSYADALVSAFLARRIGGK
jgi:hypothetical protein